jgi:hypothetical protein
MWLVAWLYTRSYLLQRRACCSDLSPSVYIPTFKIQSGGDENQGIYVIWPSKNKEIVIVDGNVWRSSECHFSLTWNAVVVKRFKNLSLLS